MRSEDQKNISRSIREHVDSVKQKLNKQRPFKEEVKSLLQPVPSVASDIMPEGETTQQVREIVTLVV